jgi:predicted outer membrane repeat protein
MSKMQRAIAKRLFSIFVMVIFLCPCVVLAATINVPADQPTIQAGIDAAVAGDTVLVADGTYTGEGNRDIDFKGKAITVQSENGAANCIIDCERAGRGFYFHENEGYTSVIMGLSITNGYIVGLENNEGGGIYCYNSSPTIKDCIISSNESENCGGGIYCYYSVPTITNCTIDSNVAKRLGGGVFCFRSPLNMVSTTIRNNEAYSDGGGVFLNESSPDITKCLIQNNISRGEGGGINCSDSSPTILYSKVIQNLAYNEGGGIYCGSGSSPDISSCNISKNISRERGGGIYTWGSSSRIMNNLIFENEAPYGGGIYCNNATSVKVINCTISANTADENGGGIYCDASESINNSILWANSPEEIYSWDDGPTVTYSDIQGGYIGEGNINRDPKFNTRE